LKLDNLYECSSDPQPYIMFPSFLSLLRVLQMINDEHGLWSFVHITTFN